MCKHGSGAAAMQACSSTKNSHAMGWHFSITTATLAHSCLAAARGTLCAFAVARTWTHTMCHQILILMIAEVMLELQSVALWYTIVKACLQSVGDYTADPIDLLLNISVMQTIQQQRISPHVVNFRP